MLALGHEIVRLVDAGLLKDLADAAELLGFTRARVTQIVDLTLLAPDIQEALLFGDGGAGQAEHRLRAVVAAGTGRRSGRNFERSPRWWRELFEGLVGGKSKVVAAEFGPPGSNLFDLGLVGRRPAERGPSRTSTPTGGSVVRPWRFAVPAVRPLRLAASAAGKRWLAPW
jgi:hypothetical protein